MASLFAKVLHKFTGPMQRLGTRLLNTLGVGGIPPCDDPRTVVSLTTYPARLGIAHYTIGTLMRQRVKPDAIHLWLSADELSPADLPRTLRRMQRRGLRITFVEGNIRSYKKLIYALEAYPEATIITADDDCLYPRGWLAMLLDGARRHPGEVVCLRGHRIKVDSDGHVRPYREFLDNNKAPHAMPEDFNLMPTGVGGVLYPPRSLDGVVTDRDLFMRLAPTADDIWFKACSMLAGRKSVRCTDRNITARDTSSILGKNGLWYSNLLDNANDPQLKAVFDHFGLWDRLAREHPE